MRNYEYIRIGDLGRVVTGKTPSTEDESNFGIDFPFITPTDIPTFDEKYIEYTERGISKKAATKLKNNCLPKDSICFVCIGSTIGKMCLSKRESFTNQQINSLIVNKNYDAHYIFYLLRHIRGYFQQLGAGTGSGKGIVNKTTFEKSKIQVIKEKHIQKRIADVLAAYDDLIENNNKRIALLEKAAQELYKEWFVRFRFPGHENTKFINGLPEGWEVKRIFDYGTVETGKTPSTEIAENYGEDIMFVKTPDMHGNMFVIQTSEYLSERGHKTQPKKLLPADSIMVSCIGTGGVVSINAEPAHTNQQINSIILNDTTYLEWLYFTCKSLKITIELFGATGATMTNLSKGKFEKLKVIDPGSELIIKYHNKTENIFKKIKFLLNANKNLIKQRDLLLPRLMSGKLEV